MTTQSRRRFLTALSLAGAAGLVQPRRIFAAENALETTTVRIADLPGICIAPQYVAEELLRAEGFADVRYVRLAPGSNTPEGIASGEVDFGINFASVLVTGLDHGVEMTVLGGLHVGCFELFVNEESRSLIELKGKRVGITYLGSPAHLFLAAMAAHVGIDPGKDLHWVASGKPVAMDLFTSGKVDAFLGFPRTRKSCAPRISGGSSSTAPSTVLGLNISAACWRATGRSSAIIRSRQKRWCGPCSRPMISASATPRAPRNGSSTVGSHRVTTMRCRR